MTLEQHCGDSTVASGASQEQAVPATWAWLVADRNGHLISWDDRLNRCDAPVVSEALRERDLTLWAPNGLWHERMAQLRLQQRVELQLECGVGSSIRQLPVVFFNRKSSRPESNLIDGYVGPARHSIESEEVSTSGVLDRRLRMEILGELGAGLAHDMRNYLTVATGAIDMLRRERPATVEELAVEDGAERWLQSAESAIQRAVALSTHMIDFGLASRGVQRCNVAEAVSSALALGRGALKSIDVDEHLPPDLLPAACDPLLLENVLLNLLINARDAMAPSGRVDSTSGKVTVTAKNLRSLALGSAGPGSTVRHYVQLCVSDEGPGIAPELQERIFEPYFSTKRRASRSASDASEPNAGSGLGLASARRLLDSVDGTIELASTVGAGAAFTVTVPAARAAEPVPLSALKQA